MSGTAVDSRVRSSLDGVPKTKAVVVSGPGASAKWESPEPFQQRLAKVRAARNPLREASRVLLRAQADMPDGLRSQSEIAALAAALVEELHTFESLCVAAGVRRDHMLGARYCLCAALDEAALQTDWGKSREGAAAWNARSLAAAFREDGEGGQKIYLLIGYLMTDTQTHLHLLEVIYRLLSCGFEGRYRLDENERAKHEALRKRLYEEIAARRGNPAPLDLFVSEPAVANGERASPLEFPLWITVAVLSVILLGMFGYFRHELNEQAARIRDPFSVIERAKPNPAEPAAS
ncbi:hypothetical protein FAZ69_09490 [Trinickia terrae]|uniref:Type IV / VI secretion system DotU domain-containing protein n=1 Tax=Trinickia terrae TaxID=2571161 RepID=A0A4U1I717_9BURK|nr:type IVB secretion system protein IcmH/DotU [Trinickia terrae]TKC89194.1 hypothetical protein FAZ69_09490 [Trinickia terrae]